MKKVTALFVSLFLVVAGVLLWPRAEVAIFKSLFRSELTTATGQPFRYEKVSTDEGRVRYEGVQFYGSEESDGTRHEWRAKQMDVVYSWTVWKPALRVEVALVEPTILVDRPFDGAPSGPTLPPLSLDSWWDLSLAATVQDGSLLLRSSSGDETLTFNGDISLGERLKASIAVNALDSTSAPFSIELDSDLSEATFDLAFQQFAAPVAWRCLAFFEPVRAEQWEISEGELYGRLVAYTAIAQSVGLDGDLVLKGVNLSNKQFELAGFFPKSRLAFNGVGTRSAPLVLAELVEPAQLSLGEGRSPLWSGSALAAELRLEQTGALTVETRAEVTSRKGTSELQAQLTTSDLFAATPSIYLDLSLASGRRPRITAKFDWTWPSEDRQLLEVNCERWGREELLAAQILLKGYHPRVEDFHWNEGTLSLQLKAKGLPGLLEELEIDQLAAERFHASLRSEGMAASGSRLELNGRFDLLAGFPIGTRDLTASLSDGTLSLPSQLEGDAVLEDLHAAIRVKDGVIEESTLSGKVEGFTFSTSVYERSQEAIASFQMNGRIKKVAPFLPAKWGVRLERAFANDRLTLSADLLRREIGVELLGRAEIEGRGRDNEELTFGCELSRHTPSAEEVYSQRDAASLLARDLVALNGLTPPLAAPSRNLFFEWSEDTLPWIGLKIENGWLKGDGLPLETYLSSFLFPEGTKLSLTGKADAQVSFSHNVIRVDYRGEEIELDGPGFRLTAPLLGEQGQYPGVHFYDFRQETDYGFLPLTDVLYYDKDYDLAFERSSGVMIAAKKELFFDKVSSEVEGIRLRGDIAIDHSSPERGVVDVVCRTDSIEGSFSDVKRLLTHFDSDFLTYVPLDGQVVSPIGGAELRVAVRPMGDLIDGNIRGALLDGSLATENGQVVLQGVSLDFDYQHDQRTLRLANLAGQLLVGDEENTEIYTLASRDSLITGFPRPRLDFDVRVEDATRDLIRLVGSGRTSESQGDAVFEFQLDPHLTTVGLIRPNITHLALREWQEIVALRAEPVLELGTLLDDLERFSNTGWFLLSPSEIGPLKDLDVEGKVRGVVTFDPLTTTYSFSAVGDSIRVERYPVDTLFLSGKRTEKKWSVEQLQLDALSLSADIFPRSDRWDLGFVGLRFGSTLLVGLEGKYWGKSRTLIGDLKLVELDLEKLEELPSLAPLVERFNPKGMIKGAGSVKMALLEGEPPQIEVDLGAKVENLEIAQVKFESDDALIGHYRSEKGFGLEQLVARVTEVYGQPTDLSVGIGEMRYDVDSLETSLRDMQFAIPAERLPWLAETLQAIFPERMNSLAVGVLSNLKKDEALEGSADVTISPTYEAFKLSLYEGDYHLGQVFHTLRDFTLEYDPYELKASGQYLYRDNYYWLSGRTSSSRFDHGQLVLGSPQPTLLEDREEQPLVLFWEFDEELGLQVKRMEGAFAGLEVHLNEPLEGSGDGRLDLVGQVHINGRELAPLLAPEIRGPIEKCKVGAGYELNGRFSFAKEGLSSFTFDGSLLGRNFELFNHRIRTLNAKLTVEESEAQVRDLAIVDLAGSCHIPKVSLVERSPDRWHLDIPEILAEDVRPSRMQPLNDVIEEEKSLVLRRVEFLELAGVLGEPGTFVGTGRVDFVNSSRDNLRNTLLVIPSEILRRIGITSEALTPVIGSVHFDIHDERLFLTEFEDVFSEQRISKFYLPSGPFQSNIDFSGNLNVEVRMKQYNILFKLAELFTIAIDGTLWQPTFSLKKQRESEYEVFDGQQLLVPKG